MTLRQIILANLPGKEKDKFYDFLLQNNVEFTKRGEDVYVATVWVDTGKERGQKLHDHFFHTGGAESPPRNSIGGRCITPPRGSVAPRSSSRTSALPDSVVGVVHATIQERHTSEHRPPVSVVSSLGMTGARGKHAHRAKSAGPAGTSRSNALPGTATSSLGDTADLASNRASSKTKGALKDTTRDKHTFLKSFCASRSNLNVCGERGLNEPEPPKRVWLPDCVDPMTSEEKETIDCNSLQALRSVSFDVLKAKYKSFSSFLAEDKGGAPVKCMLRQPLLRLIEDIYEARAAKQVLLETGDLQAQQLAEAEGRPLPAARQLSDFPHFCYEFMATVYGVKALKMNNCWSLLASVELMRSRERAVDLFAEFLCGTFDASMDLTYFMMAMQHIVRGRQQQARSHSMSKTKEIVSDIPLDARSCISIVRAATKHSSYSVLRRKMLDRLDEVLDESPTWPPTCCAGVLLWHHVTMYHEFRCEWEAGQNAEEVALEDEQFAPWNIEDNDAATSSTRLNEDPAIPSGSTGSAPPSPRFGKLPPSLQASVKVLATKLIADLATVGFRPEEEDVLRWAVWVAERTVDKKPLAKRTKSRKVIPRPYHMTVSDFQGVTGVFEGHSRRVTIVEEKPREVVNFMIQVVPRGEAMVERDRLMKLDGQSFEQELETNVRKLLLSATEDVANEAMELALPEIVFDGGGRGGHYYLNAIRVARDHLVDEFAPVADAMMEAVVLDDFVMWCNVLNPASFEDLEAREQFDTLHDCFHDSLGQALRAVAVLSLCSHVVKEKELVARMEKRAYELLFQEVTRSNYLNAEELSRSDELDFARSESPTWKGAASVGGTEKSMVGPMLETIVETRMESELVVVSKPPQVERRHRPPSKALHPDINPGTSSTLLREGSEFESRTKSLHAHSDGYNLSPVEGKWMTSSKVPAEKMLMNSSMDDTKPDVEGEGAEDEEEEGEEGKDDECADSPGVEDESANMMEKILGGKETRHSDAARHFAQETSRRIEQVVVQSQGRDAEDEDIEGATF